MPVARPGLLCPLLALLLTFATAAHGYPEGICVDNCVAKRSRYTDAVNLPGAACAGAAQRIGEILKTEPSGAMLRLSVLGGGCSGFQYKFDVEREAANDDVSIVRDGITMVVDPELKDEGTISRPSRVHVLTKDGRTLAVEDAGDRAGRPVLVHVGTPNSRHLYGRTVAAAAPAACG